MIENIKSLSLLRNGKVYQTKQLAEQALTQQYPTNDGVAKLARYLEPVVGGDPIIRTLVGFYANADEMQDNGGGRSSYSILDIDGGAADVEALRQAIEDINAKIGTGIDGTTLTLAIEDINKRMGTGFTEDYTVADALAQLEQAMTVTVTKSTESPDYAAVYSIVQGDTEVATINIPKDQFVKYAAVVKGTWSGDTFTPDPEGPDTAIEIQFQVEGQGPIYINVKDLVSMYVGGNGIEISGDTVSVKIAGDSEAFLSATPDGLLLSGVQAAIDEAIENAKLIESDGIKILGNNKIKAHAATMTGEVLNPIFVDEEGIKLNSLLDCGFYDFTTKAASSAADIAAVTDPETTNLVVNGAAIDSLTAATQYNSLAIVGGTANSGDIKANAKNGFVVESLEVNGGKGTSNGRILFTASTVNISNSSIASGSTAYNVFEGTQSTAESDKVKKFDVSDFIADNTQLNHNVFNIYNPANDAVINIKDSYFNLDATKSNPLRISNVTNATGVTINLENITWTYENGDKSDVSWAGLIIYQAFGADVAYNGDTSKIATWKINVKDCVYNGVKVNANNFGLINQVAYLYGVNKSSSTQDAAAVMTMTFA